MSSTRLQHGTQKSAPQAAALMRWRLADLVDPELRVRVVWMNVVDSGYESDNQVVLNSHRQMVSRVTKEHIGHGRIDRIVKDIRCDIH